MCAFKNNTAVLWTNNKYCQRQPGCVETTQVSDSGIDYSLIHQMAPIAMATSGNSQIQEGRFKKECGLVLKSSAVISTFPHLVGAQILELYTFKK